MDNLTIREEMKLLFKATEVVRSEWLETVEKKVSEIMVEKGLSRTSALKIVHTSEEVVGIYTRLLTLYGILGMNSDKYINALEDPKEIKKAA